MPLRRCSRTRGAPTWSSRWAEASANLDLHRLRILKEKNKKEDHVDITRSDGLGEMQPKMLWATTLSPKSRKLLRVQIADALQT